MTDLRKGILAAQKFERILKCLSDKGLQADIEDDIEKYMGSMLHQAFVQSRQNEDFAEINTQAFVQATTKSARELLLKEGERYREIARDNGIEILIDLPEG